MQGSNLINTFIPSFEGSVLGVVKIAALVVLLIYMIFSLIVVRQIGIMNKVLQTKIAPILFLLGFLHLIAAIFVFLVALVSL